MKNVIINTMNKAGRLLLTVSFIVTSLYIPPQAQAQVAFLPVAGTMVGNDPFI